MDKIQATRAIKYPRCERSILSAYTPCVVYIAFFLRTRPVHVATSFGKNTMIIIVFCGIA